MGFEADIWLGCGDREVNAKSLLSILALGATGGTMLCLHAQGRDAPAAVDALAAVIAGLRE